MGAKADQVLHHAREVLSGGIKTLPEFGRVFTQKETITYAGVAAESGITLTKGTNQNVLWVEIYFAGASAGAAVLLGRKGSAMSTNEKNDAHADSDSVMIGEGYLVNGSRIHCDILSSILGLRVNLSLGSSSGTVYVRVRYAHD